MRALQQMRWLLSLTILISPLLRIAPVSAQAVEFKVGISDPVAAARLKELVANGLLVREPYREPGQRTRYAYRLSEMGADLFPALAALIQWGDRWLAEDDGPVELRHRDCGAAVHAQLRCEHGHEVGSGEIELARRGPSPGLPASER